MLYPLNSRKNQARALDSMQASLEAETRAKAEALRIKKKIETEINELEIALDHANKANAEAHKTIKRYQTQYRDVETGYEEECRQRQEIADRAGLADRRANALQVKRVMIHTCDISYNISCHYDDI